VEYFGALGATRAGGGDLKRLCTPRSTEPLYVWAGTGVGSAPDVIRRAVIDG
jgi:hypothetical protein